MLHEEFFCTTKSKTKLISIEIKSIRSNTLSLSQSTIYKLKTKAMRMLYIFWAIVVGILLAIQASTNTALRIQLNSPWISSLMNFGVGLLALIIIIAIVKPETFGGMRPIFTGQVPIWKILGGFMGAFFVTSITVLVPKLGIGNTVVLYLFGQIVMSMIIDHYGLLGMPVDKITIQKGLGVLLLLGGVALTQIKSS